MKCSNCNKKFSIDKTYHRAGNDDLLNFCSEQCMDTYFKKHFPSNKNKKNGFYFGHISDFSSFNEFKESIIGFLKKNSFNDLREDSFAFACTMQYTPKYQKPQIKAINKVLDGIYGKNKVRWGFINPPKYDAKGDFFWAPYLVIDEETFFYYPKNKLKLDTFIRKKLKDEKIY